MVPRLIYLHFILDSMDSIYLSLEIDQSMKEFSVFIYLIQQLDFNPTLLLQMRLSLKNREFLSKR